MTHSELNLRGIKLYCMLYYKSSENRKEIKKARGRNFRVWARNQLSIEIREKTCGIFTSILRANSIFINFCLIFLDFVAGADCAFGLGM